MPFHGINYNILIRHSSYSGVYPDEFLKMRALQRDKYDFGVGTKLKNYKRVVHIYPSKLG